MARIMGSTRGDTGLLEFHRRMAERHGMRIGPVDLCYVLRLHGSELGRYFSDGALGCGCCDENCDRAVGVSAWNHPTTQRASRTSIRETF